MRILLASDAPWAASGYGVQVGMIARMLRDCGQDVAILATFGLHGATNQWHGIDVFPGGLDGFGNDVIGPTARSWHADIVITLKDLWVYRPHEWGAGVRWVPMVPVDHDPLPPGIAQLLRAAPAFAVIAYAPFGVSKLADAGFAPLYAPHSYDTNVFYPEDRAIARQQLGIADDVFAVGMVAVNRGGIPSRKAWPQNLEGFALFARQCPTAHLFCHTWTAEDGAEGGINLPALADQLGIVDRVHFIDQAAYKRGVPDSELRRFYTAMDVLNATSIGEGFGVPTLEAQACGTPVIAGDWCAQEDLVFAGISIPKEDALRFYDAQASYAYVPHPHAIAGALAEMQQRLDSNRGQLRRSAIDGARDYDISSVREHWRHVCAALTNQLAITHRGVLQIVPPASIILTGLNA